MTKIFSVLCILALSILVGIANMYYAFGIPVKNVWAYVGFTLISGFLLSLMHEIMQEK